MSQLAFKPLDSLIVVSSFSEQCAQALARALFGSAGGEGPTKAEFQAMLNQMAGMIINTMVELQRETEVNQLKATTDWWNSTVIAKLQEIKDAGGWRPYLASVELTTSFRPRCGLSRL